MSEQLFVGFYDDIAERPKQLLSDVVAFLQVAVPSDLRAFYEAVIIPPAGPAYESCDPWRGCVSIKTAPRRCLRGTERLIKLLEELRELPRRYGERVEGWL